MKSEIVPSNARCASIDQLLATVVAAYLSPVPKRGTFRYWLKSANVPRFKANPLAVRGGGTTFYQVAAVEKLLASRTGKAIR